MGIQQDSRFAGGREDFSVDLVWYSAGHIIPEGYTIEVQIPLKSIRFAHKDIVEMGVIFERRISRRSEQGTFPPLDPERGYFFLTQMVPMEFHGLKRYTLLELLPAYTHSQDYNQRQGKLATEDPARDISLTAKYGRLEFSLMEKYQNKLRIHIRHRNISRTAIPNQWMAPQKQQSNHQAVVFQCISQG
jgi:hypothetical protein